MLSLRLVRPLALLSAVLAMSGCASSYGAPINGDRALSPEEQRLQAVETKLAELSRRFSGSETSRDQRLAEELGVLRGSVEQLQHDLEVSQRKSQDQFLAVENRLKLLETAAAQQQAAAAQANVPVADPNTTVGAIPSTPVQPTVPASAAADEEAAYLRSFDLLKAGKYDEAIRGFGGMLEKYPQGNYSDNAWYWMGECYNIKKDYVNALQSYRALLEKFTASPKVPDALLKTGTILQEQKKTEQARAAYQRVIKEYPNSTAATQSRSRLAQLR